MKDKTMRDYLEIETPPQEIYDEIKVNAITIWESKEIAVGEFAPQVRKVNLMMNRGGRVLEMYRMLEDDDKTLLIEKLSEESADYILMNY